ncbi:MAG TPA: aminotransferase class V-fold PLP-dependent enzyme [Candidatus Dormibacteraeota bacterium]|nr:aminotransferase class V-fold PLP-dependent enzyme [Candidatus Dormibacteraeota bacterium]
MSQGIDVAAVREQFPVTGRWAWLNTATYGPPPRPVVAAQTAFLQSSAEGRVPEGVGDWWEGAQGVRERVGRLIGAGADDIAFLKSTGEGIGLVALGLDWRPGDEVVSYDHEFPSGVYPWLAVGGRGVKVRFVRDRGRCRFDVGDVEALLTPRTRVVSLSLVNFVHGFRAPIEELARLCRERGIWLVVDAVQAAGALRIDVGRLGAHLVSAHGYKSLCAGYGISLCYVSPELRKALEVPAPGWKSMEDVTDVSSQLDYRLEYATGARRYESGVPNLAGMYGLGASAELFWNLGVEEVEERVLQLADQVATRLEARGYRILSSRAEGERSGIVSVDRDGWDLPRINTELRGRNVACAIRRGAYGCRCTASTTQPTSSG